MELNIYDIIKKRIITEKSVDLHKKFGKIVFHVHMDANKNMIRQAVEKIWDVKVDNVRVIINLGKNRTFLRKTFKSPDIKKAIVKLKKGYKIDLPGNFETMGVTEQEPTKEKDMSIEGK